MMVKHDMSIKQWLIDHSVGVKSLYWLATDKLYQQAVTELEDNQFMADAVPLFVDAQFDAIKAQTPWLIPVSTRLLDLSNDTLSQGIVLQSELIKEQLILYLRSLLTASLLGELVLFRFYSVKVLAAMLEKMDLKRQQQLLGPISLIILQLQQQLNYYHAEPEIGQTYLLPKGIWWQIKPEEISSQYDAKKHAYVMSRRLWQLMPEMMKRLDEPLTLLEQTCEQGLSQVKQEQIELWAICQIALIANVTLSELSTQLWLTPVQQQEAKIWMEIA